MVRISTGRQMPRINHTRSPSYRANNLRRLLLPVGTMEKPVTREHARRMGLPVHEKAESQDICFVEGGDYRDVLERIHPEINRQGPIVDRAGTAVGTHPGIANYTIGQRAKLPATNDGARYVTRIERETNTIVIGREDELLSTALRADEVNLLQPRTLYERTNSGACDGAISCNAGCGAGDPRGGGHAAVAFRGAAARRHAGTIGRDLRRAR